SPAPSCAPTWRIRARSARSSGARAALTPACSWARCAGTRERATDAICEHLSIRFVSINVAAARRVCVCGGSGGDGDGHVGSAWAVGVGVAASREGPGVFQCNACGRSYRWRRTLLNHVKMECGKEPAFQCPYCPLRSKRKGNIAAHIRYVHMRDGQARQPTRPNE
ncbi:Longitudinals lacking protein, isoform G, partial [Gryllus bimaculatus]